MIGLFASAGTVRVAIGRGRGPSSQSDQLCDIALVIDRRIVERAAVEVQILGLGHAHRVQQLEAGDIGVAPRGDEQHLAVQQFLLGIEHVEDVAGADRLLGAGAFERQLVGGDRDRVRFDRLVRRDIGGVGAADVGDDQPLDADRLLLQLAAERLRLADRGPRRRRPDRAAADSEMPTLVAVVLFGNVPLGSPATSSAVPSAFE